MLKKSSKNNFHVNLLSLIIGSFLFSGLDVVDEIFFSLLEDIHMRQIAIYTHIYYLPCYN